jgi:hypothetical protein
VGFCGKIIVFLGDDLADGWHFNALSCSACSGKPNHLTIKLKLFLAFFRRSVAEQKI